MKKINFSDIKGILSRDEMKQIKGGSMGDHRCNAWSCTSIGGYEPAIYNGVCGTAFENPNVCVCFNPATQAWLPTFDCGIIDPYEGNG